MGNKQKNRGEGDGDQVLQSSTDSSNNRAVLRKLECEQIEPVAIRTKRVGRDFIALLRFNKAEELQMIMRNRLMLGDITVG